jgi:hypothetical protein
MIRQPNRIWWTALIAAWFFDFLFWKKSPGISFSLFVGITLGAGLLLARWERISPARKSLWLLIPVMIFALGTFIRREPFTTAVNYLLAFLLMGLLVSTFTGGKWTNYGLSDYIANSFRLMFSALAGLIELRSKREKGDQSQESDSAPTEPGWKKLIPVLRGLLLAFPIVALFAALLASADPIFSDYLENFVDIFRLENLPEYIFRCFYILLFGYLLTGIYIHALSKSQGEKLIGEEKSWIARFLGFTESVIVLGSVVALFAIFVGIQFRYFFGGQANIKIDGYTYAEYARRGFSELVVVAIFSLLLFLGLSAVTRREESSRKKIFSGLGVGLVVLVVVILVSAFQRLLLYETAYGFTRLRTYSHVFMVWLGLLLAAVVVLELLQKQRSFALAMLVASVGFVLTLNILNVDGLIVRQNVNRTVQGEKLDPHYLNTLSNDATPALWEAYASAPLEAGDQKEIAAILACQAVLLKEKNVDSHWQSFHWADTRALWLLDAHRQDLAGIPLYQKESGSWWVSVNGDDRPCKYDPLEYY